MLLSDYHIHSCFSGDSNENLENIVVTSLSLGLKEIAITDHYDYDVVGMDESFMVKFDEYVPKILELKDRYRKEIDIKLGLEFGMQEHLKDHAKKVINRYPFDFILSSVHAVEKIDVSFKEFFIGKTSYEAHEKYFQAILKNLNVFEDFSVCSHLDFITRYGGEKYRTLDYIAHGDIIEEILKKIIVKGKGIEINTSGFRYGENRFYPCTDLIKRYFQLGGEIITIGSDAHKAQDIGKDFQRVYDFLNSIGVKYISSFKDREVSFKKLGGN